MTFPRGAEVEFTKIISLDVYKKHIVFRVSESYIASTIIEQVLNELYRSKIRLLGVDAFILKENSTEPLMNYVLDFSLSKKINIDKMYELSKRVVNEASAEYEKNLYFNLVLE